MHLCSCLFSAAADGGWNLDRICAGRASLRACPLLHAIHRLSTPESCLLYPAPPPAGGRCAMPTCVRGAAWAQAPHRRVWPGATAGRCVVFPVRRACGWLVPEVKHGSLALLRQQAGLRSMHTVHCLCCSAECQARSNQHSSQQAAAAAAAHAAQLHMPNPPICRCCGLSTPGCLPACMRCHWRALRRGCRRGGRENW